jgi:hypothetical protein
MLGGFADLCRIMPLLQGKVSGIIAPTFSVGVTVAGEVTVQVGVWAGIVLVGTAAMGRSTGVVARIITSTQKKVIIELNNKIPPINLKAFLFCIKLAPF